MKPIASIGLGDYDLDTCAYSFTVYREGELEGAAIVGRQWEEPTYSDGSPLPADDTRLAEVVAGHVAFMFDGLDRVRQWDEFNNRRSLP